MVTSNSFIEKLKAIVLANYTNEHFGVSDLVDQFGMSRSQLHRKLKVATGQSVSQFIREYRLKRSRDLIDLGYGNLSEITMKAGFRSLSYFSKCYKDFYGVSPKDT